MIGAMLAAFVSPVQAREGSGSHGGDAVQLADDRVVLADSFLKANSGKGDHSAGGRRFVIYPELKAELALVSKLLAAYGCKFQQPEMYSALDTSHKRLCDFITKDVANAKETEYYLVDKLDRPECQNNAQYTLPVGAKLIEGAACTWGGRTYLRTDVFSKMSVRDQAKLMIHERMRALPKAPFLSEIAEFTGGVETMLNLYYEQKNGKWRELTAAEHASMAKLLEGLRIARLVRPASDEAWFAMQTGRHIAVQGGGLVPAKGLRIESGAYVGVGSIVFDPGVIGANSRIFHSELRCGTYFGNSPKGAQCRVGAGTLIHLSDVRMKEGAIGSRVSIVKSAIDVDNTVTVGAGAKVENSKVQWQSLSLGAGSLVRDTEVGAFIGPSGVFAVGASAKILNSSIHATSPRALQPPRELDGLPGIDFHLGERSTLSWVDESLFTMMPRIPRPTPLRIAADVKIAGTKKTKFSCLSQYQKYGRLTGLGVGHQTISSSADWLWNCSPR